MTSHNLGHFLTTIPPIVTLVISEALVLLSQNPSPPPPPYDRDVIYGRPLLGLCCRNGAREMRLREIYVGGIASRYRYDLHQRRQPRNPSWTRNLSYLLLHLSQVSHILSQLVTICLILTQFVSFWHNLSHPVKICLILSQFVTICHSVSQFVTIYHILSRFVTFWHTLSHSVTICHILSQFVPFCHNFPFCHNLSQCVTICHILSRIVPFCHDLLHSFIDRNSTIYKSTCDVFFCSCFNNSRFQVYQDRRLVLRAQLDIAKGDEVTIYLYSETRV